MQQKIYHTTWVYQQLSYKHNLSISIVNISAQVNNQHNLGISTFKISVQLKTYHKIGTGISTLNKKAQLLT